MDYLQTNKSVFNYKYYKNAKSFHRNRITNVVNYSNLTSDFSFVLCLIYNF